MDVSQHDMKEAHEAAPIDEAPPQLTKGGRKALKAALRVEKHMTKNSRIASAEAELYIPRFEPSELELGPLLGTGGFNYVFEVNRIVLDEKHSAPETERAEAIMSSEPQKQLRKEAAQQPQASFAVKYLNRKSLADPDRYCIGAADLVLEAKLLASLDCIHIIKLRGLPASGTAAVGAFEEMAYFLLLDRLPSTLNQKMDEWHRQQEKLSNPTGVRKLWAITTTSKKKKELAAERLQVSLDIADALEYLHSKRIIYRDLKTENVGFDVHGVLKLFDLGLAKELKPGTYSETYHLTGHTGSLRFMAPENARHLPYNLSADVYSFGILLWNLYSLETPFEDMSRSAHSHRVVYAGERPRCPKDWPESLVNLMKACWHEAPYERPTMPQVKDALFKELDDLGDSSHHDRRATSTRSGSFVLNRDAIAEQPIPATSAQTNGKPRGFVDKVFQRLPSLPTSVA